MKKILMTIMAMGILYSCNKLPIEPIPPAAEEDSEVVSPADTTITCCRFVISSADRTKSSIAPNENVINDINIYVYRDGKIVEHVYESSPSTVTIELNKGNTYNFYAMANIGRKSMPDDEAQIGDNVKVTISSIQNLVSGIPMAWKTSGVSLSGSSKTVNVKLERLAARIGFSLDSSLINGLKIKSVRLLQSASVVRPFLAGGSKATSASETINGDYAISKDLSNLNSGNTIYFYAMENKQNNLLPQNTDPWNKVPDALGSKAGLCTYIEAVGTFEEGFLFKGSVTYRFYLGKDNTSDFSVIRNSDMHVTLTLTGEGLTEISWKVEPDVEVQPGFVDGYIDESLHPADDMYIGEKFWYYMDVHPDLVTHLGGDLNKCSLKLVSSDGGSIKFDEYDNDSSRGVVYARGTCWSKGTGTIWICDPSGNPVTEVSERFNIQKPRMVASFYSSVRYGDDDIACDEPPYAIINGTDEKLHIYLVDNDGYNLNNDYLSGFDLTPFTFERDPYRESDYDILDNVTITMTPGTSESNGPAATYTISCKNSGNDPDMNYELSRAVRGSRVISIDIDELNHSIYNVYTVDLGMQPVTLTMVDNGWADYGSCQLSMKIKNPSNMPLIIKGWQVNRINSDWNAISRNEIIDDVEDNMTIDQIAYITNSSYQNQMSLYGQQFVIYSERNSEGDQYITDGDQMVYPLEGISTDDMHKAMLYRQTGQDALHHLIDVMLPSGRLYSSEVTLVDNLEDGSMKYSIIYGDDPENPGWNNQGMWLYSNGSLIKKANTTLDTYYNVTAKHLTSMFERYDSKGAFNLIFTYDADAGQLYARCESGNIYNIKIDSEFTGTVKGYVETFPNGTWGSGKDNNCTATISGGVKGVSIGTTNVSIDGGAIKAGFDAIYAQTFFDSKNWIGSANSYQHSAHPTSLTLNIKLTVSSASTVGLYPFTILWRVTSLPYYHAQDGTTYNPSMTKTVPCYSFYRVKRNK